MSERIQALAQVLTGKRSVDDCTVEELQQLTHQYPYFAPAQFLLLQKLRTKDSADYIPQQQKAILYYHDPLQFEEFISSDKFLIDDSSFEYEQTHSLAPAETEDDTLPIGLNDFSTEEESSTPQKTTAKHNAVIVTTDENSPTDIHPSTPDKEQSWTEENKGTNNPFEALRHETTFVPVRDEQEHQHTALFFKEKQVEGASNPAESLPAAEEEMKQPEVEDREFVPVPELVAPEPHNAVEKIGNEAASGTNESVLLFEPYHTVDYFASQGIKVSAVEVPTDKLGKQLKSFTEWLKTMKRLPATEITKAPESTAEKTVENMANHSVEESDVVTETMAEVWAKQGAREKAVETYNKLSLLNPSKRAYFAAKIENLKQP